MDKPRNMKALKKLLGQQVKIKFEYSKDIVGEVTGVSCSRPRIDMMDDEEYNTWVNSGSDFVGCWVAINSQPKLFTYDRVKLLEKPKKWWQIWR